MILIISEKKFSDEFMAKLPEGSKVMSPKDAHMMYKDAYGISDPGFTRIFIDHSNNSMIDDGRLGMYCGGGRAPDMITVLVVSAPWRKPAPGDYEWNLRIPTHLYCSRGFEGTLERFKRNYGNPGITGVKTYSRWEVFIEAMLR